MQQGTAISREDEAGAFFSRTAVASVPWILVGKIFTFIAYIIISAIIVRGLGAESYGIYALLTNIAECLVVFCALGLNTGLLRFIPELITHNNRSGMIRLLSQAASLQLLSIAFVGSLLYFAQSLISQIFHLDFGNYTLVVTFLMAMLLSKEYLNNVFTSMFRARFLAYTSVGQALVFGGALLALNYYKAFSAQTVLLAFGLSIASMGLLATLSLLRFFRGWKGQQAKPGIGHKRVMRLTLPIMFNAVTNKLLQQYSEVFFLAYFVAPSVVGFYTLGYSLAFLILTFIPMALHTLFTSAFAEAYARNTKCLGSLTSASYQILIALTIPMAAFGFFFAPKTISLIYGADMAPAGSIASFFFIFCLFPMVAMPLSMALTATEKVKSTMWLNGMKLVINLILDYFFIKAYGTTGAMAAISLTYLITAPIKLRVISRLIGGIFFPFSFFIRIATPSFALSAALWALPIEASLITLPVLAAIYGLILLVTLRGARLINDKDVSRFRSLGIKPINAFLDLIVGSSTKPAKTPLNGRIHRLSHILSESAQKTSTVLPFKETKACMDSKKRKVSIFPYSPQHTHLHARCSKIQERTLQAFFSDKMH